MKSKDECTNIFIANKIAEIKQDFENESNLLEYGQLEIQQEKNKQQNGPVFTLSHDIECHQTRGNLFNLIFENNHRIKIMLIFSNKSEINQDDQSKRV